MGTYSVLKTYIRKKNFIHDDDVVFIKLTNATTHSSESKPLENLYVGIAVQRLENVTHSCDPNSTVELEEKNGNVKKKHLYILLFLLNFLMLIYQLFSFRHSFDVTPPISPQLKHWIFLLSTQREHYVFLTAEILLAVPVRHPNVDTRQRMHLKCCNILIQR